MFFKKAHKTEENNCPIKEENNIVKCSDCSTMIDKQSANKVTGTGGFSGFTHTEYYCTLHAKKYESTEYNLMFLGNKIDKRYYKTFEVDENGNILKTKKK